MLLAHSATTWHQPRQGVYCLSVLIIAFSSLRSSRGSAAAEEHAGSQVLDSVPKRALSGHEDGAATALPKPATASPRPSSVRRRSTAEEASSAHEGAALASRAHHATSAAPVGGTSTRSTVAMPDGASASQQQMDTKESGPGS